MYTISIHEAQTRLDRFVDQAAAGEEIVISRAGKPVARLMPLASPCRKPRQLGLGKGKFLLPADFDTMNAMEIQRMFEQGE
ncbi:MAG: type II toxin-antitoxin system Phd/YefM family antitoxin [Magnetococcales bacterium]|nr:type II toxin-antitoxin system Phd/YefM family antitoxin [Magnetococcales bacterium]NGZ07041.1 type II toxin-antitoxin system Phd/YefM family antitoxin [Magnetococcales bacterium]